MSMCQGCGKKMDGPRYPATESWHEFCGDCNKSFYEHEAKMRDIEEELKNEKWNKLVARYGYETACEIIADGG